MKIEDDDIVKDQWGVPIKNTNLYDRCCETPDFNAMDEEQARE